MGARMLKRGINVFFWVSYKPWKTGLSLLCRGMWDVYHLPSSWKEATASRQTAVILIQRKVIFLNFPNFKELFEECRLIFLDCNHRSVLLLLLLLLPQLVFLVHTHAW
jgi:hypothetical protein